MSSVRLCFLDSVSAARCFLQETPDVADWTLFSVHYSVVDYIESKGYECTDISAFIDIPQIRETRIKYTRPDEGGQVWSDMLSALEELTPPEFFNELGVRQFPLFSSAAAYTLFLGLIDLELRSEALTQIVRQHAPNLIRVYEERGSSAVLTFADVVRNHDLNAHPCEVDVCPYDKHASTKVNMEDVERSPLQRLSQAKKTISILARKTRELFSSPHERTLLAVGGLYDFDSLLYSFCPFNVLTAADMQRVLERNRHDFAIVIERAMGCVDADIVGPRFSGVLAVYWDKLRTACLRDARMWLEQLLALHHMRKNGMIHALGVGNSPFQESGVLVRYAREYGLPVIGMQHGANYAAQEMYWVHYLSDYSHCTHFLTYGWDSGGLRDVDHRPVKCEFIPVGSTYAEPQAAHDRIASRSNRVVFPITNCTDCLGLRLSPTTLAMRQKRILQTLDRRTDLDAWVKPFPGATDATFAWTRLMNSMEHLRVARARWRDFVRDMRPGLVVIEYPSSPLFEILDQDVDIFLMMDPTLPFLPEALGMLEKRCHVFHSTEALVEAIEEYGTTVHERLRNADFYNNFVYRAGARQTAVASVAQVLQTTFGER